MKNFIINIVFVTLSCIALFGSLFLAFLLKETVASTSIVLFLTVVKMATITSCILYAWTLIEQNKEKDYECDIADEDVIKAIKLANMKELKEKMKNIHEEVIYRQGKDF